MSKTDFQNGFALGMASGGVVEVVDITEIDALDDLIDESGVLEDTEGTVTEKVEELIDKAEELDVFMNVTNGASLFKGAKSFPSKAVVNLPNANSLYEACAEWTTEQNPIVEELTVNAPNINVGNNQSCLGRTFSSNNCVKKVILNVPDECMFMMATFANTPKLEEVVLNFSTKNITTYLMTFQNSGVKIITGVLDFSNTTNINSMFWGCYGLIEVRFAPNTLSLSMLLNSCGNLTSESIQSIIDGLATVTTAQNLTLHTDVVAKLTEEQILTIQNKNWNVL